MEKPFCLSYFVTDLNFLDAAVWLMLTVHLLKNGSESTQCFPQILVESDGEGSLLKDQLLFCSQKEVVNVPSG